MNNRREEYLDLVLNILLEDSIITHSNRNWWLESPWIQDNGIGTPHVGLFNYMLPYTLNSTSDPFGKYCRDNYGLTDKEIYDMWRIYHGEMWKRYYKLSSGKLNESVDNKKTYLDKIIKWFVDDTIIDYEKGIIIYPFSPIGPTGKPLPSFIDDLKNRLSWGMPSDVQINCRDTYGLNYDETKYVWDNYKTIIKDRYNKESIMYGFNPINESVDRKKEYLNRIVDFIVQDTEIDYKNDRIEGPFPILSSFSYLPSDRYVIDYFSKYCEDTYGLTDDEIKYVWKKYINKIVNKKPIKESVDRKQEFLDKVANFIVDDSVIEYEDKSVKPPFTTLWFDVSYICNGLPSSLLYTFFRYCEDAYNLNSVETNYVWEVYSSIICNKFNNSINESVDRKDEYLNKIVEFLVDDTKVLINNDVFFAPFYRLSSLSYNLLFRIDYPASFSNYTKDMYGLTDDDIKYVWDTYKNIIIDKFDSYIKGS